MLIDIVLGIIFLGSFFTLWYRVSEKIPEVVAIRDEVITQRLHENSARLRIFLLHFKTFYKEEYYQNLFWNFLGKIFYRLHILVLRVDNYLIRLLKKCRARNGFSGLFISEQAMQARAEAAQKAETAEPEKTADGYWSALRDTPEARPHAPRKRSIEGVRVRIRTRKSPIKAADVAQR